MNSRGKKVLAKHRKNTARLKRRRAAGLVIQATIRASRRRRKAVVTENA